MKNINEQQKIEPEQDHRNQVFLRILLPILTTVIVCLAAFLFLIIGESGSYQSTAQWADISVIFLILPAVFLGLILLVLLILLSTLSGKWNQTLPPSLKMIRIKALILNLKIRSAAEKPTKLFIAVRSFFAGIKSQFTKKAPHLEE